MDRVTYASVRVNPNELFTVGNGDGDDVRHGSDQDPGVTMKMGNGEPDQVRYWFNQSGDLKEVQTTVSLILKKIVLV